MPAKKKQSSLKKSKNTTTYKQGGSVKNEKVHPLKHFNDQRENRIKAAYDNLPSYQVEGEYYPLDPASGGMIKKTNEYDGNLTPADYRAGEKEGYHPANKLADASKRQVKKAIRKSNRAFKKMERKDKKGKNKTRGKKNFDNKWGIFTDSRRSMF